MDYFRPGDLGTALNALADGERRVVAGATDFYPMLGDRTPDGPILDITAIPELRGIREDDDAWRMGALTTWTDIIDADLPPAFDGLRLAAREVGSIQIQNRGTIAGNLCNASPAADGVPPLLTLDAEVELTSATGSRYVGLQDFIDDYRSTVLRPDELVTAVIVPRPAGTGRSAFLKLGARKYLVISIAMVAVRLEFGADRRVGEAAVAVGACSVVAQRLERLEADLAGHDAASGFAGAVRPEHLTGLSPIGDVRATESYRRRSVAELVERALGACLPGMAA